MAKEIRDNNYEEVEALNLPIVMDFWAQWCGPCKTLTPVIDQLAEEFDGRAVIGKVDVDDNADLVEKFAIRSVPTVLFVKDGKVVDKAVGAVPKNELLTKLNALLEA